MALDALKNFAQTTVSTGYNSAATSIVLSAGGGLLFPAVPFNAVWWNSTDYTNPVFDPSVEIVRVTAISTDTLTITRAQEGTSASNKNTASKTYSFQQSITAKIITDIDAAKQDVITGTANQIIKTGTVLSTPQDIATTSAVQHARLGLGQVADATIPLVILRSAIASTPSDGLELLNSTAAANGTQQYAPSLHFSGQGWKTTATAASQSVDFIQYVQPQQGTTNPAGFWVLASSVNGAAYGTILTYSTSGTLNSAGSITSGGNLTAVAGTFSGTLTSNGDLTIAVAKKLTVASGTNQRAGNTTLVGGTVTVSNTTVTANTIVLLTRKTSGGTIGTAITYTVSAATSFTVNSDNILDTSTFSYFLAEVV